MSETFTIETEEREQIVRQIGMGNILSISGGRVTYIADGIELPVSNGYKVRVQLTPVDDYTVTRIFTRRGREFLHGRLDRVYADSIGNVAYYAGMFRSYDAEQWPVKAVSA